MATSIIQNGPNGINANLYPPGSNTENLPCYGWITSNAQELHIYARPYKLLNHITSVSVSALKITARILGGGYVGGAENYNAFSDASAITADVVGREIRIVLKKKDSGTWGTNNIFFVGNISNFSYTLG